MDQMIMYYDTGSPSLLDRAFVPLVAICTFIGIGSTAGAFAVLVGSYLAFGAVTQPYCLAAALLVGVALVTEIIVAVAGRREFHLRADLLESLNASKVKSEELFAIATLAKNQADDLFAMTDMLQSADGYDDAAAVLKSAAMRLLPRFGASLYIFNNSRDRLDLAGSWNMPEGHVECENLMPSACWALKRGKPHTNDIAGDGLCCLHHAGTATALEVPMMARGTVFGLLCFVAPPDVNRLELQEIGRIGQSLAESMSLAVSNISLREKLRTQSLRDPLTGLYNRRYMEDALDRYVSLAERTGGPTTIIMLDLDNFKRLNDQHGHAKGDAVLRDVAAQLVGGLRPDDVVCRFGGEELLAILPNCSLDEALVKAEALRLRIEALSESHQASVSASIGVASIPETSTSAVDLIPMADAALYEAKHKGKNCVAAAPRRASRESFQPRVATSRD